MITIELLGWSSLSWLYTFTFASFPQAPASSCLLVMHPICRCGRVLSSRMSTKRVVDRLLGLMNMNTGVNRVSMADAVRSARVPAS
eukprot:2001522-Rhodomonas_salina.1